MKFAQVTAVLASITGSALGYGPGGTWGPSAASAFSSYAAAHSTGWDSTDYSSFTSKYGSFPTGTWNSADYSSFTSQYGPVPTGWKGPGPGFGGPWGHGAGGWKPGYGGPFGGGNYGPYGMNGSWTSGAWTKWWDGDKCPPSTWSGWTSGSWSTNAPWTTWTACSATATATSTYTTALDNGTVATGTSYGYQVAQATQTSLIGAAPVGKTVASGAAALAFIGAVLAA